MRIRSLVIVLPLMLLLLYVPPVYAYSYSSDSIYEFSETLPNDEMFLPDSIEYDQQVSTAGSAIGATVEGDYTNTSADDSSYYKTSRASGGLLSITLNFSHSLLLPEYAQEGTLTVDISHNVAASTAEMCYIYNFTLGDWDSGVDTSGGNGYYNFTLDTDHISSTGLTRVKANETAGGGGSYLWFDYALSSIDCYTNPDNISYVETFSDISDWTEAALETGDSASTDNDVVNFESCYSLPSGGDYDTLYINCGKFADGGYYEFRGSYNSTNATVRLLFYEDPNIAGSYTQKYFAYHDGDYWTYRGFVAHEVESIRFLISGGSAYNVSAKMDYLRFYPLNSSIQGGYQHDCSTTAAVSTLRGSAVSDGDSIQYEFTGGGPDGSLEFTTDTTTTKTYVNPDYYPFLSWYCENVTTDYTVKVITGSGPVTVLTDISDTGTVHANIRAVTASDYYDIWFILDGDAGQKIALDWVKAYSIANFTVTKGSATTVNDYICVSNNRLVSSITPASNVYLQIDYDITLSVSSAIYDIFSIDATNNNQWFAEYIGGWQSWKVDILSGDLGAGTITDFRLLIDGSGVYSSILFIDTHAWHDISEADFVLWVPFSAEQEFLFNTLLITFGLAMMPTATVYLAIKRNDMDTDKIGIACFLFLFGFALFVGGVMP